MQLRSHRSRSVFLLLGVLVFATAACEREDGTAAGSQDKSPQGRIRLELTDAPLDDPAIDEVYLTITGVALDGEPLEGLTERRTVDLSNYTGGRTTSYGTSATVRAGTHEGLTITLDLERDAEGRTPGAYATNTAGAKTPLDYGARTAQLFVADRFSVERDGVTELVLDVDLRRAVQCREGGGYTFGSESDLAQCLRLVDKRASGSIEGAVSNHAATSSDQTIRIVYAFPRGGFDAEAAGAEDFSRAATSAKVSDAGRFRLSYLPAGAYDLVVVDYEAAAGDGTTSLIGARVSDAVVEEDVRQVVVSAQAQTRVELVVGEVL